MPYISKNNMFISESFNDYWPLLNIKQTLSAVDLVEQECFDYLRKKMNLLKVLFPNKIFLATGLDRVMDIEHFHRIVTPCKTAKWGRCAIKKYGISPDEGIIYLAKIKQDFQKNNSNYFFENSLCWERILNVDDICISRLRKEAFFVAEIVNMVARNIMKEYGLFNETFGSNLKYMSAQSLEDLYPNFSPTQREYAVCRKFGVVFIEKTGVTLNSGNVHSICDPDVDDWNFSGILLVWNSKFNCSQNIAQIGIRVSWSKMVEQFDCYNLSVPKLPFHDLLKNGVLPCTIGGSINLSSLSMLLLNKVHIGEVVPGVWDDCTLLEAKKRGIHLL